MLEITFPSVHFADIVNKLVEQGYAVVPEFIPQQLLDQIIDESREQWESGEFRQAHVGHGNRTMRHSEIRSDHILWLDPPYLTPAQTVYLHQLDQLRLAINETLFLGLFEFEGHFAVYPSSSFYKKHLDQFKHNAYRQLTCITYLNKDWQVEDGGQLRLYLDGDKHEPYLDILPEAGTAVIFLSAQFYHEVLPAHRERMSLTGWFCRRRDPFGK